MKKVFLNTLFTALTLCATAQPVYKDVAPVFYSRCTGCHHTGAHKYPFMNYTQTAKLAPLIKNALLTGIMPPWSPDTSYTRFQHERVISATEKQKILDWIDSGPLKGDTTKAPAPPVYNNLHHLSGQPDLILSIGQFTSSSTFSDKYYCFSIPTGLAEDRIVRAIEVVPGNKEIVHHAVIMANSDGTYQSDLSGYCYNIPGDLGIGTYAPGAGPTVLPSRAPLKAGITLKAGSNIVVQLHYPAGSAGEVDSTSVRLFFYPKGTTGVRTLYSDWPLQNWNMQIPANTITTHTAWFPPSGTLPLDFSLFAVMPHSHLLCKSILMYAVNPGVDTIPLIKIKHWDFEWQDYYFFKKLLRIPAGYKVYAEHVFDNTTANHHNPHNPPQTAYAGTDTDDEMLFDGMLFLLYETGDEFIDVESIINSDPLLGMGDRMKNNIMTASAAFPNPATNSIHISYRLPALTQVMIEISGITGNLIYTDKRPSQESGAHEWIWSMKDNAGTAVPPGVYFYKITTKFGTLQGKIVKNDR